MRGLALKGCGPSLSFDMAGHRDCGTVIRGVKRAGRYKLACDMLIGLDSESLIAFAITNMVPAKSNVSKTKLIAVICCDTLRARKNSGT